MKLRNKKTGEIIIPSDYTFASYDDGIRYGRHTYYSLAELNAEWEDYEEPKEHWFINFISGIEKTDRDENDEPGRAMIEIGNYFETKEEAEKAVRKLKAWQRLKDKGFRFNKWTIPEEPKTKHIKLVIEAEMDVPDSPYDLDLLFGGEE